MQTKKKKNILNTKTQWLKLSTVFQRFLQVVHWCSTRQWPDLLLCCIHRVHTHSSVLGLLGAVCTSDSHRHYQLADPTCSLMDVLQPGPRPPLQTWAAAVAAAPDGKLKGFFFSPEARLKVRELWESMRAEAAESRLISSTAGFHQAHLLFQLKTSSSITEKHFVHF